MVEGSVDLLLVLEQVPKNSDAPAGAESRTGLRRPRDRVDPMPRLAADKEIEGATGRIPVLEVRHLDVESVSAGDLGHPGVGLDAQDLAPAPGEQPRRLAGAATHVEHPLGLVGQEVVDELRRVRRPGPVVLGGVLAERSGSSSILVDHRDILSRAS